MEKQLVKFTYDYGDRILTRTKICAYPERTNFYKDGLELLNENKIVSVKYERI